MEFKVGDRVSLKDDYERRGFRTPFYNLEREIQW